VADDHRFQVNLRGIIDLLGNHLYNRPEVFLRELLQNAVDAVTARRANEPDAEGLISLEVTAPLDGAPTLTVADDGIGMTESDVHAFLATIGESSKRAEHNAGRELDFLGQFGIGLLAGFMVADEIVVITQSRKPGEPAVEWRGRLDGSYGVRVLQSSLTPGTRVHLTARRGSEDKFGAERVRKLAEYFGGLLPYRMLLTADGVESELTRLEIPWQPRTDGTYSTSELLEFGERAFGERFLDAVPLSSRAGGVEGVAFVLPHAASAAGRRAHRVYLKNMLLTETADNLLPPWAFFVKAVVNVRNLRPVASRESFYDDERLEATRTELGVALQRYLRELSERDPQRFERFIAVHHLALKALASEDEEAYRTFIDWFPFETTLGRKSMRELRTTGKPILYVDDISQFSQIAKVAIAQGDLVVNAGYVYDAQLIARIPEAFDDCDVRLVDAAAWTHDFEDVAGKDAAEVDELLAVARSVLRPHRCRPEVRRFRPTELPALFVADADVRFQRSLEQSQEKADSLFGSVLESLASQRGAPPMATLCLNFDNPLIKRLKRIVDEQLLGRSIEMIYVQALLLAQQPLTSREVGLMNGAMIAMLDAVTRNEGARK